MTYDDDLDENELVKPRSGSFRIVDNRLPTPGEDYPRNRAELEQMFASERDCLAFLERLHWPRGFACPECGSRAEPWRSSTGVIACSECRQLTSLTRESIFGGSVPLQRWFRALWEATDPEGGMSVAAVQRVLRLHDPEVARKSLEAVRSAMALAARRRLRGQVELARANVEVKQRGRFGRTSMRRLTVALAAETDGGGQLRARVLPRVDAAEMLAFARAHVARGTELLTGSWPGYGILAAAGFRHQPTLDPQADEVDERVAMSEVQQASSLLRLWLWSTPDVTTETVAGHLDEFTFRFNRRGIERGHLFYQLMVLAALPDRAGVVAARTRARG